jgi:hypothetical protein
MAVQVRCKVTFTDNTIEIKNLNGGSVEIDSWDVPESWDWFTEEEMDLIRKLTEDRESPYVDNLSNKDMLAFKKIHDRVQEYLKSQGKGSNTADDQPPNPIREDQGLTPRIVNREIRKNVSFADDAETRINGHRKVVEESGNSYFLLWYYINSLSSLQNPSSVLWNHGFRFDGSCWVIPESHIQHWQIKEFTDEWDSRRKNVLPNGKVEVDYCIIRQPDEYKSMFRSRAQKALDAEIRRAHQSFIDCCNKVAKELQEIEAQEDLSKKARERAEAKQDNTERARIREARKELEYCLQCALAFDMTESVSDLISGLRAAIRAQTELFNDRMEEKGSKRVEAT